MKVERIDHIHIKVSDIKSSLKALEDVIGTKFLMEADFTEDQGTELAFNTFPIGFELMKVTDKTKGNGKNIAEEPYGVVAISLKVPNIDEAIAEMEAMGFKLIDRYGFGEIKEALFDSKKACGVNIEFIEFPGEDIQQADDGGVSKSGNVQLKPNQ